MWGSKKRNLELELKRRGGGPGPELKSTQVVGRRVCRGAKECYPWVQSPHLPASALASASGFPASAQNHAMNA